MKYEGFTLIELLITMTIIVLMALVAIPGFGKSQRLIELQSKSDEIKAGLDEMHTKAMNPEKGIARYFAQIDETNKQMIFKSCQSNCSNSDITTIYKTININSGQTLTHLNGGTSTPEYYLACDVGKNFCCNMDVAWGDCTMTGIIAAQFVSLGSTDVGKTTSLSFTSNPFRVISVTTP